MRKWILRAGLVPLVGCLFVCWSQQGSVADDSQEWAVTAAEIPMRDGVKLHTLIAAPRHPAQPLPMIMQLSPYGAPEELLKSLPTAAAKTLSERGYIRVWQDIRGKYKSEGTFVMLRPPHAPDDAHGIDESTDTYDTIEWLLKNVPGNNGRVGIMGTS